jgi:predicted membrane metal-binding protein
MRDPTYHAGDGILFIGYPRGAAEIRVAAQRTMEHAFLNLNYLIGRHLEVIFPQNTEALAKALLLGDDFDLDYATDMAFKISGIRHIVAVSGL